MLYPAPAEHSSPDMPAGHFGGLEETCTSRVPAGEWDLGTVAAGGPHPGVITGMLAAGWGLAQQLASWPHRAGPDGFITPLWTNIAALQGSAGVYLLERRRGPPISRPLPSIREGARVWAGNRGRGRSVAIPCRTSAESLHSCQSY